MILYRSRDEKSILIWWKGISTARRNGKNAAGSSVPSEPFLQGLFFSNGLFWRVAPRKVHAPARDGRGNFHPAVSRFYRLVLMTLGRFWTGRQLRSNKRGHILADAPDIFTQTELFTLAMIEITSVQHHMATTGVRVR